MADKYKNYAELERGEAEREAKGNKRRYEVELKRRSGTSTVVIAPHGGSIERGTSEVACAIAGAELSYAAFKGLGDEHGSDLHITSSHFDEPKIEELVEDSEYVVAIHGEKSSEPNEGGPDNRVFMGGKNQALRAALTEALEKSISGRPAFQVLIHDNKHLQGTSDKNICNRGHNKEGGVQLELPKGTRESFFKSLDTAGRENTTAEFQSFVTRVRNGLVKAGALPKDRTEVA